MALLCVAVRDSPLLPRHCYLRVLWIDIDLPSENGRANDLRPSELDFALNHDALLFEQRRDHVAEQLAIPLLCRSAPHVCRTGVRWQLGTSAPPPLRPVAD